MQPFGALVMVIKIATKFGDFIEFFSTRLAPDFFMFPIV